ncbi:MAG: lipid-binding SYLF domain-containing protein [Bdellovibrionales bacterium]|nr:lipid-binding SYLF domain-containing protein [Bdellovibrionales bacterium]
MKMKSVTKLALVAGIVLCTNSIAIGAPETASKSGEMDKTKITQRSLTIAKGELTDLILASKEVYRRFTTGENPRISKAEIQKAKCLAIFPGVKKVALVIGGKHGDGVVTCTTPDSNDWSRVGFVDLRGASFGAQLGVKSSDVVMLFTSEQARENLKKGKVRFGTDLGYTFGNKPRSVESDKPEDVIVYSDSEGAFASASLKGSYVVADDEELKAFYEEETNTLLSVLTVKPSENTETVVEELLLLLPS